MSYAKEVAKSDMIYELIRDLNRIVPEGACFDMSEFGEHEKGHHPAEQNYCGTSACLAGWLSLDKKWQMRGFDAVWRQDECEDGSLTNWYLAPRDEWCEMAREVFGRELGNHLAELFYQTHWDIDQVRACLLGMAWVYTNKGE